MSSSADTAVHPTSAGPYAWATCTLGWVICLDTDQQVDIDRLHSLLETIELKFQLDLIFQHPPPHPPTHLTTPDSCILLLFFYCL